MHNDAAIDVSTSEAKKPEIITFYNLTKGAVDVVDEMSATYSTARISNRWPMTVFFSILNTAAINARILLLSAKSPQMQYRKRSLFLKNLALELLKEHVRKRNLQPALPCKLPEKLDNDCSEAPPTKKQKCSRKRCHICPSKIDRKSQVSCDKCSKNVCGEHSTIICRICQ